MVWAKYVDDLEIDTKAVDEVIDGLINGRNPGFDTTIKPNCKGENYVAPNKHIDVFKDIIDGYYTGYLSGPFEPTSKQGQETYTAPIGTVIKLFASKDRVIHNLSKNKELDLSINSFISEENKKVEYESIRDIVEYFQFLGPNAYISVWDMFEAYRQVKVNPKFHKFLGFEWYGKIYRYTCLPFGLASAPKIYSEFAEVIREIAINRNPKIWKINAKALLHNYLDDYWAGHIDLYTAWKQFLDLLQLLIELGIPTQWRKVEPPSQQQKLWGFIFNIKYQIFYVSQDKVDSICDAIDEVINNPQRTKTEIASIKGKLLWAGQVIRASKIFLRGLDKLTSLKVSWKKKGIEIPNRTLEDLYFWKELLRSTRNEMSFGYYLRDPKQGDIHVWTDAATTYGTGIGGYTSTGILFQAKWIDIIGTHEYPTKGSTGPELLAVVAIATYLKEQFKGKSILFHCDNSGVIPMITKEKCNLRNDQHLRLIRHFVSTAFDYKFKYWAEHIPGTLNVEADALSRFYENPMIRLYGYPRPTCEHTAPFYLKNPQFNWKYKFTKIDITQHTQQLYIQSLNRQQQ